MALIHQLIKHYNTIQFILQAGVSSSTPAYVAPELIFFYLLMQGLFQFTL
jgi:hypothetical protein